MMKLLERFNEIHSFETSDLLLFDRINYLISRGDGENNVK